MSGVAEGAPDVAPAGSIGAYYLCLFVAIGGYGPFMAVELASRGVATDRLADALSLLPIVRVLAGPAWSAFADRVRSATWALRVATFGAAAAFLGVVYAPSARTLVAATLVFAAIRAPVGGLIDAVNLQRVSARGGSFGGLRQIGRAHV